MKRILFGVFAVVLMVSLGLIAHVQAAPPHKIYRVEQRATSFGGTSYVLGFAATDILNKKSAWVRGSVLESTGSSENIKVVGKDPKKRTRSFFTCSATMFEEARKGARPFNDTPEKYKDLMVMITEQRLAIGLMTLDPTIKTVSDLKGKRVSMWPKGSSKYNNIYSWIAGAGKEVLDKIEWQYTMYEGYSDIFLGKVDAVFTHFAERGPGKYVAVPSVAEFIKKAKNKVYIIGASPKQRELSRKLYGDVFGATAKLTANSVGPGIPETNKLMFMTITGWGIYPDVPEHVVYEIVKTLHENYTMFKDYHKAGANYIPENFGLYPAAKELWHPGARKYYEEKGIEYGTDYFYKRYPLE